MTDPSTAASDALDFRIDWGYAFVYSRRHYHPEYRWDGEIHCTGGSIDKLYQLDYPYTWWGPVHTAREMELPGTSWKSTTRRGIAGIRVVAHCNNDAQFTVSTVQGEFTFTAAQVRRDGRIVFQVGWKYSHCTLIVTRTGFLWYRNPLRPGEINIEAAQMRGADLVNFSRMEQRWIEPGQSATFDVILPTTPDDGELSWLFHLQAMIAQDRSDPYKLARDYMPIEIRSADHTLASLTRLFRWHDGTEQILHDIYHKVSADELRPGSQTVQLVNRHDTWSLLVHRVSILPVRKRHLQMMAPVWVLVGREFIVSVHVLSPAVLSFEHHAALEPINVPDHFHVERGVHEFRFVAREAMLNTSISVQDDHGNTGTATIEAAYDIPPEQPEVKVGYDMTTVPHDEHEFMDWLLEYTWQTQLGNLVCFRPFPMGWGVDDKLVAKWGNYCRDHQVYVEGINMDAGSLPATAGDYFHGLGTHELSGKLYFRDPNNTSRDMREAMQGYIAAVRAEVERLRVGGATRVAFGDASGGHRYALLAGADFLRAETMVPHTQQHLSQARAAAQALGCGEWGVHIAIQHPRQPYLESHLGWYYLSLLQAWMMGASFLYEEDSLFMLFKEERQGWDDKLTSGKRDMTRKFYRFASTHPRPGSLGPPASCRPEASSGNQSARDGHPPHPTRSNPITWSPQINIAFLLGRYAAPFNGFICDCEQDPSYSVWGEFGRNEPAWGHLQPEKSQQVLDVLMPGASTHPVRQRYDRRRFFFSGTPFGDFDQVPAEATAGFLQRYKLLLHLGWNTMIDEDYDKLKQFVVSGGTLLIGVPQFSTHVHREFLLEMNDLALYRDGDFAELCGARILGKGVRYCGHWAHTGPDFLGATCPTPSRVPSVAPDEDGPCHLAEVELHGAQPVLIDAISGKPMLLKYSFGAGTVYLVTTWAYAGHEELADFSGAVVAHLASSHKTEVYVTDSSNGVFWTWWPHPKHPGCGQLMLLNTDWTEAGNEKQVTIHSPAGAFESTVSERQACIATVLPFAILQPLSPDPHIQILSANATEAQLRIHAVGMHELCISATKRIVVEHRGRSIDTKMFPAAITLQSEAVALDLTLRLAD